MAKQECPIEGCPQGRADRQLMCKRHWYMVPKELRDKVFRTARRMWDGEPKGTQEWSEASDEAIAAVEIKEAA
jgi:hypothetical protein